MTAATQPRAAGHVRLATPADHDAIHRLNYRTFVEEIPQHPPNDEGRLVDRFHDENVYAVYEVHGRIVGMISGRTQRPFSLDQKLGPVDAWLPPASRPVEIRLLAVEPEHRASRVFTRLVQCITAYFMAAGYDVGIASGTTRQLRLYRHLGFIPFGPLVGTAEAPYQPMYITGSEVAHWSAALVPGGQFLSGPVEVLSSVRDAFARPSHAHRGAAFAATYRAVQEQLCALTGATHATLLLGSGTLANDVIGAQLQQIDGSGVVVSNGEFGERLADHAARLGLPHTLVQAPWGAPLDFGAVDAAMRTTRAQWLWAVHSETSTGVLNDLDQLRALARRYRARLALDTVSSVGAVPLHLDGVCMASAVSGKALAAYPGVAIVLHDDVPLAARRTVPRYLDLALAWRHEGVPFTQSSNLLDALHASLVGHDWPSRFLQRQRDARQLRHALEAGGLRPLADSAIGSPGVFTLPMPHEISSADVGEHLHRSGWQVGFQSTYLRQRNWLQLCLFGEYTAAALDALPRALLDAIGHCAHPALSAPRVAASGSAD